MFDFIESMSKCIATYLRNHPNFVFMIIYAVYPILDVYTSFFHQNLNIEQMWQINNAIIYHLDIKFIYDQIPLIFDKYINGEFEVLVLEVIQDQEGKFKSEYVEYKIGYNVYSTYIYSALSESEELVPTIKRSLSFNLKQGVENIDLNFQTEKTLNKDLKNFILHEVLPIIESSKRQNAYSEQILNKKTFYVHIYDNDKLLYIFKLEDIELKKG